MGLSPSGVTTPPNQTDTSSDSPSPASCQWLLTHDGERRGLVIESDLKADAPYWELHGNGRQGPPLDRLQTLCGEDPATAVGIAFNGGFWNEHLHPVGVCAGQAGIHAARSHRWGFAIGEDRAWIGHMNSTIRLTALPDGTSSVFEKPLFKDLAINPRPLPRKTPYLIDTRSYPWPLVLPGTSQVIQLQTETDAPLVYNTHCDLISGEVRQMQATSVLPESAAGLLLIFPELETDENQREAPIQGTKLRLTMILKPVDGAVRLVTCGWPQLLSDGHLTDEVMAMDAADSSRTARTAIGCDREGRRLWAVLLNRGLDGKEGVTLAETARTLTELGATEALNLDGGSSTQAWCPQLEPEMSAFFPLRMPVHHALFLRRQLIKKPSHP